MKKIIYALVAISVLVSCKKFGDKKGNFEFPCDANSCQVCGDDTYNDPSGVSTDVQVYYVEAITTTPDGLCKTGGFVKYLKNGKTVALVKYGTDANGSYGIKTNCVNGDCEHKNASTCTFRIHCVTPNNESTDEPTPDPNAN